MSMRWAHIAGFAVVMICWFVFAALFLLRKKPPREKTTSQARLSLLGIGLQGAAYGIVWMVERPRFTAIVPLPGAFEAIPSLAAGAISIFAVWLTMSSIETLGKEWSYEARLVEGHRLVTAGPYGWVRHPIYTAMLLKLISTGLVVSHWIGLLGALLVFGIGTMIRVKSEEKLLRTQFGAEYEEYARRVPAILPHP